MKKKPHDLISIKSESNDLINELLDQFNDFKYHTGVYGAYFNPAAEDFDETGKYSFHEFMYYGFPEHKFPIVYDFAQKHSDKFAILSVFEDYLFYDKTYKWAEKCFALLSKDIKNTKLGKEITKKYHANRSLYIGQVLPHFEGETITGEKVNSKQLLGKKATVIVFWNFNRDDDADELRLENLRPYYETYKDKGLAIIAINTDENSEFYRDVSKKYFPKYVDLGVILTDYDNEIRTKLQYQIYDRNNIFYVDANGVILEKDIWIEDQKQFIERIFE